MPARNIELLLLQNVEGLGIVGDIVNVKPGFARNYLLPQELAEVPTAAKQKALEEARAKALAELQALREARQALLERMQDVSITIERSCNDQGVLYGSVTQRDISDALHAAGYEVSVRSVRLNQTIRRVGSYVVPIQFDADLRTEIAVEVEADRSLEDEREEMEFDDEGNLIEKPKRDRRKKSAKAEDERTEAPRQPGDASAAPDETPAGASTDKA